MDFLTKHVVLAEFSHENKDGWVSVRKHFDTAKLASEFFEECRKDSTCLRAQKILIQTHTALI